MDNKEKKSTQNLMRMEELCNASSLSRSTVYQYLRAGILHPPVKESPTQMRYDETHLKQLQKIKHLRKNKKMSIQEIQKVLDAEAPQKVNADESSKNMRNLIFEKALELFSRNGVEKTKISDIADALNLGKGTIYLYFRSKEELFLECIERFPEIILSKDNWEEIRKEPDYFQRSHKRMFFMLKSFPSFLGVINIAKSALTGDDPNMKKKAVDCFQTITNALSKDMKKATQKGIVRDVNHGLLSFVSFGIGEALGYWMLMNPDAPIDSAIRETLEFTIHGLMAKNDKPAVIDARIVYNGIIEDLKGNSIALHGIRFNDQTSIEGKMGDGKLQISADKIRKIDFGKIGDELSADVTMMTGEMITIAIDENMTLSGKSTFGIYSIDAAKIKCVGFILYHNTN